jgi:hypothetical protein
VKSKTENFEQVSKPMGLKVSQENFGAGHLRRFFDLVIFSVFDKVPGSKLAENTNFFFSSRS